MIVKPHITLALVLLMLTAGCAGVIGGDQPAETPTPSQGSTPTPDGSPTNSPTSTAEPTPTATPSLSVEDVEFPDGVSTSGVNGTALTQTHFEAIKDRSHQFDFKRTTTFPDVTFHSTFTAKWTAQRASIVFRDSIKTSTQFSNDSMRVERVEREDSVNYGRSDDSIHVAKTSGVFHVDDLLAGAQLEPVDAVRTDDGPLIKLNVTGIEDAQTLRENEFAAEVKSINGTIIVDEDGMIHSMDMNATYVNDEGNQYNVHYEGEWTADDSIEIEKPDWVSTAIEEAGEYDIELLNNKVLALTPKDADIPAGSRIWFSSDLFDGHHEFETESPLEDGETLYFYVNGDGDPTVSRTKPDMDNTQELSWWGLTSLGPAGVELFSDSGGL